MSRPPRTAEEQQAALRVALAELNTIVTRLAQQGVSVDLILSLRNGVVTNLRGLQVMDRAQLAALVGPGVAPRLGGRRR